MAEVIERRFNITRGDSQQSFSTQKWQQWETAWLKLIERVADHTNDPIVLIDNGCETKEYGVNCTEACSNSTYLFASAETLWNCVSLATVHLTTWDNPYDNQVGGTINEDDEKKIREQFNLGPLEDFDHVSVFQAYRACAIESCFNSEFGCSLGLDIFQGNSVTYNSTLELGSIMSHSYCTKDDLGIDGDLAGPGLFIAYLIQFSLSMFFVLSLNFTTTWTEYIVRACLWPFRAGDEAKTTAQKWQNTLSNNRFAGAIASTIVDLQEAQTQYLAIISVVGVVAYVSNSTPGFGNGHTFRAWYTNKDLLDDMISISIYPILFVQIALHKTGNRWWCTMLWVIFTWVVAYFIAFSWREADEIPERFRENDGLESCGQNAGPKLYCMNYDESFDGFAYNGLMPSRQSMLLNKLSYWAIHSIIPIIILDWLWKSPFSVLLDSNDTHFRSLNRALDKFVASITSQVALTILELFTMGLGTYNLAEFVIFRKALGDIYGEGEGDSVFGGWTYGQFVALFVWIPITGKFLSLLIDGTVPVLERRANQYVRVTLAPGDQSTNQTESRRSETNQTERIALEDVSR
ncbi:hypothetical protein MRS44_015253 [Fusarium solani]|uniref:uncharacterized protein n=1 Tax=Fusarium solani TaxID=169388 RepID=UPI0032C47E5C|nr:hypothetical protein MRS44_015253 [Fusarium solani]